MAISKYKERQLIPANDLYHVEIVDGETVIIRRMTCRSHFKSKLVARIRRLQIIGWETEGEIFSIKEPEKQVVFAQNVVLRVPRHEYFMGLL